MKKRNHQVIKTRYITLLHVVSAFSVVTLHTNGCFWTFSTKRYWFTANIIECVFYFAVPIFFMITGATLVNYNERYSTKEYFIKRIKKALIPFLAWSLLGLIYKIIFREIDIGEVNFSYVINGILGTSIIGIYGFMISLFCVYLCIPLLSAVPREKRKSVYTYLAIAGFVINNLVPFIIKVFGINLTWPFSMSIASGYLLYVVVGNLLMEYDLSQIGRRLIYAGALGGLMLHIIGTYRLSTAAENIVRTYKGYNNVPCILYSIGIFVFFKEFGNRIMNSFVGKLVDFLADYTLGIYMIHWYIMAAVRYGFKVIFSLSSLSIIYRLGAPFIIICFAVGVIYLMRKIPLIKNIVP